MAEGALPFQDHIASIEHPGRYAKQIRTERKHCLEVRRDRIQPLDEKLVQLQPPSIGCVRGIGNALPAGRFRKPGLQSDELPGIICSGWLCIKQCLQVHVSRAGRKPDDNTCFLQHSHDRDLFLRWRCELSEAVQLLDTIAAGFSCTRGVRIRLGFPEPDEPGDSLLCAGWRDAPDQRPHGIHYRSANRNRRADLLHIGDHKLGSDHTRCPAPGCLPRIAAAGSPGREPSRTMLERGQADERWRLQVEAFQNAYPFKTISRL